VTRVSLACDECPPDSPGVRLSITAGSRRLCATHWHAAGCPWVAPAVSMEQVHEAELRTREHMTARGGTDRHLVRNGRT